MALAMRWGTAWLLAVGVTLGSSCDGERTPDRDPEPTDTPVEAPPFTPLTDQEATELFARTRSPDRDEPLDPARLCIRRIADAPRYVRIGEPLRGGCRLAAVCYELACVLRSGDYSRFEDELMADLGWRDASAEERRALLLRWLRESDFALEPGDGPFLVDGDLAERLGVSAPQAYERDGMPKVSYWQRVIRHTRDAPDDYYWVLTQWEATFDRLDGSPIGRSKREERRIPMDEPPDWAR